MNVEKYSKTGFVPSAYESSDFEIEDVINFAISRSPLTKSAAMFDLLWDVFVIAYNRGFERGGNYVKNQSKKKLKSC